MKSTAVVVYISPKIESSYSIWCLDPICGQPVLAHLFKRLQKGLPAGDMEFLVACHEGVVVDALEALLKNTPTQLFISTTPGRLHTLIELSKSYPHIKTFMIFPETCILPDCSLTLSLLRCHREAHMEATLSSEYPLGLLPEIYEVSGLQRLVELQLPDDLSKNFASVMTTANELFHEEEDSKDLQFKIDWINTEALPSGPALEKLPSRLLIDNAISRLAAERVLKKMGPKIFYNSSEAILFKEELLNLENSISFDFNAFTSIQTTAIPILYVTQFGAFSGAEQSYANLIIHLDRTRFQPFVVLKEKGVLSEKLMAAGVPVEIADFNFLALTPWNTRYFDTLLKKARIKLIHINGIMGDSVVMAAYYAGIPLVFHVRSFLGLNAHPNLKYAAKIITVSEAVAQDLRRSDLDPHKIQAIHNGQDLSTFSFENIDKTSLRQEANISQDAFVICLIARIDPQKRMEFLLEALPQVIRKFPNCLALIVGECYSGQGAYYERLQETVKNLDLQDHVRFWGFEKNIEKIYAMSDVLVNCTLNEPFGRSILEALSMGLPVVVPNQGGHLEILRHYDNSILFEAKNPSSLATELIRLKSNPEIAEKIAKCGLKTMQNLDMNTHVRKVSQIYDQLLSSG